MLEGAPRAYYTRFKGDSQDCAAARRLLAMMKDQASITDFVAAQNHR